MQSVKLEDAFLGGCHFHSVKGLDHEQLELTFGTDDNKFDESFKVAIPNTWLRDRKTQTNEEDDWGYELAFDEYLDEVDFRKEKWIKFSRSE